MEKLEKHEVLGLFKTLDMIDRCVKKLRELDFHATDISIVMPNPKTDVKQNFLNLDKSNKGPESAVTGAGIGAAIGFGLGGLLGTGLLTLPNVGQVFFFGPLATALAGLGVLGLVGGVVGGLIGRSIPEDDSKAYERSLRSDEILLSVVTDDVEKEKNVMNLFRAMGSKNIVTKMYEGRGIGGRNISPVAVAHSEHPENVASSSPSQL